MENITVKVDGKTLVLTIDASKDLGMSKSGKTRLVASSQGNQKVTVAGREVYIGINAYTK